VASGLHPQHIIDFNYGGGSFELAHKGDTLIRESLWPPAYIPNIWNYIDVRSKILIIICISFPSFIVELPTLGASPCSFYLSPICMVPMVPILISTTQVLVK
jgi:hypothetical protein